MDVDVRMNRIDRALYSVSGVLYPASYHIPTSVHVKVIESGNVELQCFNLQYSYLYVFNKHPNSNKLI